MKRKRKAKKKYKINYNLISVFIILLVALIAIFYFLPEEKIGWQISTTSVPTTILGQWNCDDMQIDVNSMKEAVYYYRYGIQRPAVENYKFEIISLTVTNKANAAKDFSGYRVQLVAGDMTHTPIIFNEIEKISLLDYSTIDYRCKELPLAYISRFVLNPGESSTGCKIFQIMKDSYPDLLMIYNITGLKCVIQI